MANGGGRRMVATTTGRSSGCDEEAPVVNSCGGDGQRCQWSPKTIILFTCDMFLV